jgi:hypothetical protein
MGGLTARARAGASACFIRRERSRDEQNDVKIPGQAATRPSEVPPSTLRAHGWPALAGATRGCGSVGRRPSSRCAPAAAAGGRRGTWAARWAAARNRPHPCGTQLRGWDGPHALAPRGRQPPCCWWIPRWHACGWGFVLRAARRARVRGAARSLMCSSQRPLVAAAACLPACRGPPPSRAASRRDSTTTRGTSTSRPLDHKPTPTQHAARRAQLARTERAPMRGAARRAPRTV